MPNLTLKMSMTRWDRMVPLLDGEVKPDGIDLEFEEPAGGITRVFYEQIKFHRYDISEMSMSSFLRMRSIRFPYLILPVFHQRTFAYTGIHIREGAGIRQDHPEDLKSKSMGVMDYQQTAALMIRGQLQLEWGVKPSDMVWYMNRGQHLSHGGASAEGGMPPPKGVTIHYGADHNTLYNEGKLDATMGAPNLAAPAHGIERARAALAPGVKVIPLFSDPKAEAIRFYNKHKVYPFHHTTIVRESILKEHPWVAMSLMEAFQESKRIAYARLRERPPNLMVWGGDLLREVDGIFGKDTYPYGIKANTKAIDWVQTFSVQQELTPKKQPLEELFPMEIIYAEEEGN